MVRGLFIQYLKQSCCRRQLFKLNHGNAMQMPGSFNQSESPCVSQALAESVLHCQPAESFSWMTLADFKAGSSAHAFEAVDSKAANGLKDFIAVEEHAPYQLAGRIRLALSGAVLKEAKVLKALNRSEHVIQANKLGVIRTASTKAASESSEGGPAKGQNKPPEDEEPFLTPFDVIKQQPDDAEPYFDGQGNASSDTGPISAQNEEKALWENVLRRGSEAGQLEAASDRDEQPKAIEFLDVHREKMEELRALEGLTFDDVSRWGADSSAGVPSDAKALAASELTEFKLQLIGAYYDLQIVPMRKLFSWAIPTEEALQAMKEASPNGVVEVGAGSGYWASLLRERGVSVRAFDRAPVDVKYNGHHSPVTTEQLEAVGKRVGRNLKVKLPDEVVQRLGFGSVKEGGPEEAGKYPARSLLLCWPPDETDPDAPTDVHRMGVNALNAYRGSTLIYVGEKIDGGESTNRKIDRGASTSRNSDGGAASSEKVSKSAGPKFAKSLRKGGWTLKREVELPHWPQCEDTLQIWTRKVGHVAPSEPPESASLPRLRERVKALETALLKSAYYDPEKGAFRSGVVRNDAETRRLKQEALECMEEVGKLEKESQDAILRPFAREVYLLGLRVLWDDVARGLILRRVHKEGILRGCHAPFSPIEEAIVERYLSRQGLIRRMLLRFGLSWMKRLEDKEYMR